MCKKNFSFPLLKRQQRTFEQAQTTAIFSRPLRHTAKACPQNRDRAPSGHANTIRAYLDTKSVNEQIVFNAQQIEKAESCGLVYNVEANDVENPENMTRHQRAGMFGHLN